MIGYIIGKEELLDEVKPLWEKLNNHHKSKTLFFHSKFESFTFEKRRESLLKDDIKINIVLARNEENNINIGYCIATKNNEGIGEIQSIFIDGNFRGYNIGQKLIEESLSFLERENAEKILIGVASGNEEVISFYEKFGFKTSTTILERVKTSLS